MTRVAVIVKKTTEITFCSSPEHSAYAVTAGLPSESCRRAPAYVRTLLRSWGPIAVVNWVSDPPLGAVTTI